MFITACNKIFHSLSNCAAGVLCLQRIWRAMKNCLLLLLVVFLAMPPMSTFAAAPSIPQYTRYNFTISSEAVFNHKFSVSSNGQLVSFSYTGHTLLSTLYNNINTLFGSDVYQSSIFIESFTFDSSKTTAASQNPDGSWSNEYKASVDVMGGNVAFSSSTTPTTTMQLNIPDVWHQYIYDPFSKLYGSYADYYLIVRTGPVGDNHVNIWYRYRIPYTIKVSVYAIDNQALLSKLDQIDTRVFQINQKLNTVNSNLTTINSSINNGFQDTVDNLQSLKSSVNTGFTGVQNGIKQQTTQIQSSISNQTTQITQNNNQNTQKILDQNSQFRQEDIDGANGIGKVATDFVNNTQTTIKSKWEILWYPIEFTNSVLTVFTGGSSSRAYADKYNGVVGYSYNQDSGELEPIIDLQQARYGPRQSSATITFPAYTLPVLNVQIWDSYQFDLGQVKEQFSALFNALYVVIGILELYWFVGFLRSKYMDIFGG